MHSIVIYARKEEELKQVTEDISKSVKDGDKVVSIPGDISQEHVCISLIEGAVNTLKELMFWLTMQG